MIDVAEARGLRVVSDGNRIVANGKTDVRGIFQSNGGNVVLVERNGEYALLPDVGND
ncbi:MAG: hypothetical protein AB7K09_22060 [Planctomycetota bacterium]